MTDEQKIGKPSKIDGRSRNRPNGGRGRPAGIPNKITRDLREIIRNFAEQNAEIALHLWRETAKNDPARAFDQYFGALEYVTPKLNRTELSGPDGAAVKVEHSLTDAEILARFAGKS